jgi:hypothetical protein
MKRSPLRFRIAVAGSWFLRVHVFEERNDMLKAIAACYGDRHEHEFAACVYAPGSPDHGCVADLFFSWRVLRPSIVAHEASHAAWAVALATRTGVSPSSDEFVAEWVERITEKIWVRTQTAAL